MVVGGWSEPSKESEYLRVLEVFFGLVFVSLLVILAYTLMPVISANYSHNYMSTQSFNSLVEYTVIPIVVIMVVLLIIIISLQYYTVNQREELAEKIIGYVASNEETNFSALGSWMGISQKEAADIVARLVSQGRLQGIRIDLAKLAITSSQNTPISNPLTESDPVHVATSQAKSTQPQPSEDVVIKARFN